MNNKKSGDYKKLTEILDEWFDSPFSDAPSDIQEIIRREFIHWDSCTPEQRRHSAEFSDCQRNPSAHGEQEHYFELYCEREEKIKELRKWKTLNDNTALGMTEIKKQEKILKEEIERLDKILEQPQKAVASVDDGPEIATPINSNSSNKLNHDLKLQGFANEAADELRDKHTSKKSPTKKSVANALYKKGIGQGLDASTIERRIKNQWKTKHKKQ